MAAIWFSLTVCMMIAASQARSWSRWLGWMSAAAVFVILFRESSPLLQRWLG